MKLFQVVVKAVTAAVLFSLAHPVVMAQLLPPEGLSVEMLTDPGKTEIRDSAPEFGWVVRSLDSDVLQSACRVQVFRVEASPGTAGRTIWWDSGKTDSSDSVNFPYRGRALESGGRYSWRVRVWDSSGNESEWSRMQEFRVSRQSPLETVSTYPLETRLVRATRFEDKGNGCFFYDFGKAAFGTVQVVLPRRQNSAALEISLGEKLAGRNRLDREPPGTVRYREFQLEPDSGGGLMELEISPDSRNTRPGAIRMPDYTGEVMPFRYCEICCPGIELDRFSVVMKAVNYPFAENASDFSCSDKRLNEVWELCKYSIKATSFAGIYIDGDRERIPYEADAYINQLGHYLVDREYSMARASHEYLLRNPTWPTEWILHSVLMAWEDFLFTGNLESVAANFEILRNKTLYALAGENGLISTTGGRVSEEVLDSIFLEQEMRDIVDWPPGSFTEGGIGERDGHVMADYNTVVNAFHYRAVVLFARLAEALGRSETASEFREKAGAVREAFNRHFLDRDRGIYRDGIGTRHSSLHSNMLPLAFGLVPEEYSESVTAFVKSRGMACSVYGSQYLLDALFGAGEELAALNLLVAEDDRGWLNMIRAGSTITLEAWDYKYKNNLDWNHAWGAAPANLIPRWVLGVQPIEPGFRKVLVSPRPGGLKWARGKVPSIRGTIGVEYSCSEESFELRVEIPANMEARVEVPVKGRITLDGSPAEPVVENGRSVLDIGSGRHTLVSRREGF